eukprot:9329937-Prorocentrum_lima.AAC.1
MAAWCLCSARASVRLSCSSCCSTKIATLRLTSSNVRSRAASARASTSAAMLRKSDTASPSSTTDARGEYSRVRDLSPPGALI